MKTDVVLCSRVRLSRNYADLPFALSGREEQASVCINRTVGAFRASTVDLGYELFRLREMSDISARCMEECRCITPDLLDNDAAAALINYEWGMSVMMGGEDHVCIQATRRGMDLAGASQAAFRVEDALSRSVAFAFDDKLGYLTASPAKTGTGMKASMLLHLPLLSWKESLSGMREKLEGLGLELIGAYGKDAPGDLYLVRNKFALGRTEQEYLQLVENEAAGLATLERIMRPQGQPLRITWADRVYRAWGTLTSARILPLEEFFRCWSAVRVGAVLGLLDVTVDQVDGLVEMAHDAHVCAWRQQEMAGQTLDAARADRVRMLLQA